MHGETIYTLSEGFHNFLDLTSLLGKTPIFAYKVIKDRVNNNQAKYGYEEGVLTDCFNKRSDVLNHLRRMQTALATLIDAVEMLGGLDEEEI